MNRFVVMVATAWMFVFGHQLAAAGPADDSREQAKQFFRMGERAFKANQYDTAAQMFERAYRTLPLPAIVFSAAQAYRLQYALDEDPPKLKRAVELYELYLKEDPQGKRVGDAARSLAELRPILAQLEASAGAPIGEMPVRAQTTKLMVSTSADIEDARVSIDGGELQSMPLLIDVTPGRHKIVVTAEGYFPFEEMREAIEGDTRPIEVELKAKPALVSVRTESGAQVSVDGRPAGTTPLVRPLELSPGRHLVTVTRRGHRPWSREIEVERGQTMELSPSVRRTGQRTVSYAVLATSGLLAASAGVTFGLSLKAGSDASELNDKRERQGLTASELADYRGAVDRRDGRLGATYILLGLSGAVATTGLLLYFMDNPSAEAAPQGGQPLTVAPSVAAESVGLALSGSF